VFAGWLNDETRCSDNNYAEFCHTHLAAPMFPAHNVAICIKAKYAEAWHTHTHTHARTHTHTHLAAPISPAAWRHLSPGDILVASGVPGSWPESERTVPPELLACSFLPAALEHVSSVIIIIVIMMMTIIIIIVVVVVSIKNRFPAHDELGTCSDKSCLSSLSCASLKGL